MTLIVMTKAEAPLGHSAFKQPALKNTQIFLWEKSLHLAEKSHERGFLQPTSLKSAVGWNYEQFPITIHACWHPVSR